LALFTCRGGGFSTVPLSRIGWRAAARGCLPPNDRADGVADHRGRAGEVPSRRGAGTRVRARVTAAHRAEESDPCAPLFRKCGAAVGTAPHRSTRRLPARRGKPTTTRGRARPRSNHFLSPDSPTSKETNMPFSENAGGAPRPESPTADERAALLAAWADRIEELRGLADDEATRAWVDQVDPAWDVRQLLCHKLVLRRMLRDQPVPPPSGAPIWTIDAAVVEQ